MGELDAFFSAIREIRLWKHHVPPLRQFLWNLGGAEVFREFPEFPLAPTSVCGCVVGGEIGGSGVRGDCGEAGESGTTAENLPGFVIVKKTKRSRISFSFL